MSNADPDYIVCDCDGAGTCTWCVPVFECCPIEPSSAHVHPPFDWRVAK